MLFVTLWAAAAAFVVLSGSRLTSLGTLLAENPVVVSAATWAVETAGLSPKSAAVLAALTAPALTGFTVGALLRSGGRSRSAVLRVAMGVTAGTIAAASVVSIIGSTDRVEVFAEIADLPASMWQAALIAILLAPTAGILWHTLNGENR